MEFEFGRVSSSGFSSASQQRLDTSNKPVKVHAYAMCDGSTEWEATFGLDHVAVLHTETRPQSRTERQALDRIARQA